MGECVKYGVREICNALQISSTTFYRYYNLNVLKFERDDSGRVFATEEEIVENYKNYLDYKKTKRSKSSPPIDRLVNRIRNIKDEYSREKGK